MTLRTAVLTLAMFMVTTLPAVAKDCEQEPNMAAVRDCAAGEMDKQLAATYSDTFDFVRSKDPQAAKLLSTAQDSWKTFADDSCAYSVAARETETMANDARLECWATFVNARIKVLKAYRQQFGHTD